MIKPAAGRDYPGSVGELLAWFTSGADGRDYLEWLRWPGRFAVLGVWACRALAAR